MNTQEEIGDLLVVYLQGVLTVAEQQLVKTLPAEKGRNLLKEVRTQPIETARPVLEPLVQEITGVKVLSLHHDSGARKMRYESVRAVVNEPKDAPKPEGRDCTHTDDGDAVNWRRHIRAGLGRWVRYKSGGGSGGLARRTPG